MCAKALSNFFHQSSLWTKLVFNVSDIYTLFDGFDSILSGQSVFKKMHHISFRALANDVNSTESEPNYIMSYI